MNSFTQLYTRYKRIALDRFYSCKQLVYRKNIRVLLDNANNENTPWFSFEGQELEAKVVDVYDGDTITLAIPFENKIYKQKCRLYNIDTAEIRTKNIEEKHIGMKGKKFVQDLVFNKRVFIKCGKQDKYGRLLVQVFLSTSNRPFMIGSRRYKKDLSSMIIEAGLGYEYNGKTKRSFNEWYIRDTGSEEIVIDVDTNKDSSAYINIDTFTIYNSTSNNTYDESIDVNNTDCRYPTVD